MLLKKYFLVLCQISYTRINLVLVYIYKTLFVTSLAVGSEVMR